jgi:lantibiotic biosynthesis protein
VENLREKTIEKIEEINLLIKRFIDTDHTDDDSISLLTGLPGAALFLYEYAQYDPGKADEYYEKIAEIIENAFEHICKTPNAITSYCSGITGTLWLTEYMRRRGVVDLGKEYLSPDMLEYLSQESLAQTLEGNNCDLLHGGFSFWAFLLECQDFSEKKRFIQQQLNALNKIAIDTPSGRNWKINGRFFGSGVINSETSVHLSQAHGICAILALLSKTNMNGYYTEETSDNIHRGLKLVESLKINCSTHLYPARVLNGKAVSIGPFMRLAWCSGDFSVANAYWKAWKATGVKEYEHEALHIMGFCEQLPIHGIGTEALTITDYFNTTAVIDAGLCHGCAGIAQIFRRFYWETGNLAYANASDRWTINTLQLDTYADGYAGYKNYRLPHHGGPVAVYGLLDGITGIGLTLLSSLSGKPADWDSVLQI